MPPEELCSGEEGQLQAEHIQREEKLNVMYSELVILKITEANGVP